MTYLSNKEQIQKICLLDGVEIIESTYGAECEQVEFTIKDKKQISHGNFELAGEELEFHVCYQIEGQDFDVEHLLQKGEESVIFQNITPYVGTTHLKDGVVNKITIEARPRQSGQFWSLSAKNGLRFLTLDEA
jgi:hypothetical protein